jgi:hypothetical protein
LDAGLVEVGQEGGSPGGGAHRLLGCGAVEQLGADVAFEASELSDQGGLVGSEVIGGLLDGGEGHGGPEPVQSLTAAESWDW